MHAPLYHPAMKNVGPIRKELGIKTFFNMLGPMVNPAFPPNQLVGVFSLELARLYGYLYQNTDKNFSIVHSLDGYDEISLTSDFKLISNEAESVVSPESLGLNALNQEMLHGGDTVEDAAKIFKQIVANEGNESQNTVVLANAGLAISTTRKISIKEGIQEAKESLVTGKAMDVFKKFLSVNN